MSVEARIRERLAALAPFARADRRERGPPRSCRLEAGRGHHWRLTIVSESFRGKPTVARHRLVYQALGELMNDPIHALVINARAPGDGGA